MGEKVLEVVEHLLEAIEIEAVADVLLVNFTEELMVFQTAEPTDPSITLLRTIGVALRHSYC
jgi:hypothetical protein